MKTPEEWRMDGRFNGSVIRWDAPQAQCERLIAEIQRDARDGMVPKSETEAAWCRGMIDASMLAQAYAKNGGSAADVRDCIALMDLQSKLVRQSNPAE